MKFSCGANIYIDHTKFIYQSSSIYEVKNSFEYFYKMKAIQLVYTFKNTYDTNYMDGVFTLVQKWCLDP